ncbi:DUF998 domain-containing protein [Mesorhizobium sp. BR1-1-16]|uniref:DUF998 domain-containing protein n=1 Tax=Mesorhizobium sp. BR1-1-16 TaxID=2876653 RepID=UPI001CCAACBE|nr:DUF998 domain-containing protein [Mesorhizobium sp. BR1-1-16]MBZ9937815.1 DUF998 domain-containing protein [Mesorhizobium sp. BR1-1-16]
MRIAARTGETDAAARAAAFCWLGTALAYFIAETIAARAFRGYSFTTHMISDLGIPYPTVINGRSIDSPLAVVMNAGFVVQALLYASAALVIGRALPKRGAAYAVFLGAALADALGLVLIAVFHSGTREIADGTIVWHLVGASLSIVGGNLVAMSSGFALAPLGMPRFYRPAGIALGLFGISSIAFLITGPAWFPLGAVERASVYTITAWELMTAALLLGRQRGWSFAQRQGRA